MDAFGIGEIQSYTGASIKPLALTPDMIDIEDLAHTLAIMPRFLARTKWPLSIAQHSVTVSYIHPTIHALLHDTAEAYYWDIPSPVKKFVYMMPPGHVQCVPHPFAQIEHKAMGVVYAAFGLEWPLSRDEAAAVHHADMVALVTEKRDFLKKSKIAWRDFGVDPLPERIKPMSWRQAKKAFLRRFDELMAVR